MNRSPFTGRTSRGGRRRGQKWPPLNILETPDDVIEQENSEVMCEPRIEPYVLSGVRTRARAAAEVAQKSAADSAAAEEPKQPEQAAEQPAATTGDINAPEGGVGVVFDEQDRVHDALAGGESVYYDETYSIYCGHAAAGSLKDPVNLPDPQSWKEAMQQPDSQKWKEASRAERRNLKKHKAMRTISKAY